MVVFPYSLRPVLLLIVSTLACCPARAQKRGMITVPARYVAGVILRGKQGDAKSLAQVMRAQQPHTHLRIGVDTLPSASRLLPLLPPGTRHKGRVFTLPNGSTYVLVKARTPAQVEADSRSDSETRQELLARLQYLKASAPKVVVSVLRPRYKYFVRIGTIDEGIREVSYLPTGAQVTAVDPVTKVEYAFSRIAGRPALPPTHHNKDDGLRWTQQPNGRWEEVTTTAHSDLHWMQRPDGYWEEAPVHAEGRSERKSKS